DDRYRLAADEIMAALAGAPASHPLFFGRLLSALDTPPGNPVEVAVVGDLKSETAGQLLRTVNSAYIPTKVVAAGAAGTRIPALLADRDGRNGASAYVCHGFVCSRP